MLDLIIGIFIIVAAIFLVIAILMQEGKNNNLGGAIAGGGAETFFGKTKGKSVSRMLSKVTTIVAVAFVAIVIMLYIVQENGFTFSTRALDNLVDADLRPSVSAPADDNDNDNDNDDANDNNDQD